MLDVFGNGSTIEISQTGAILGRFRATAVEELIQVDGNDSPVESIQSSNVLEQSFQVSGIEEVIEVPSNGGVVACIETMLLNNSSMLVKLKN